MLGEPFPVRENDLALPEGGGAGLDTKAQEVKNGQDQTLFVKYKLQLPRQGHMSSAAWTERFAV